MKLRRKEFCPIHRSLYCSLPAHAEVSAAVAKLPSSWFHSILTRYCIADPSRCSAQQGDPDLVKTHAPTFFMVSLDVETNL
jgi:hypothetical protein